MKKKKYLCIIFNDKVFLREKNKIPSLKLSPKVTLNQEIERVLWSFWEEDSSWFKNGRMEVIKDSKLKLHF